MTGGYSFLIITSLLSLDALRLLKSGSGSIDDILRYVHLEGILHSQFADDVAKLWNSTPSYLIRLGNTIETLMDYAEQSFTLIFFSACSLLFTLFVIYKKIKAIVKRNDKQAHEGNRV